MPPILAYSAAAARPLPLVGPYNYTLPAPPPVPSVDRTLVTKAQLNIPLLVRYVTRVVQVSRVPRYTCLNQTGVV